MKITIERKKVLKPRFDIPIKEIEKKAQTEVKKKKINGSNKGSNFERTVVKQLSLWWTDSIRDDIFWRTSGSGARATTRAKKGNTTANAYGDIMALDHIGDSLLKLCCFELKCGYSPDVLALIDGVGKVSNIQLNVFWEQAVASTAQGGAKYPVVIFKRTSKRTCMMISDEFYASIIKACGEFPDANSPIIYKDRVFITFETFLEFVKPQAIRGLLK